MSKSFVGADVDSDRNPVLQCELYLKETRLYDNKVEYSKG